MKRKVGWVKRLEPFEYVPFFGSQSSKADIAHPLRGRWWVMIQRCYYRGSTNYKAYGARGVTVCCRWFTFANYLEDVVKLPGYVESKVLGGELCLDKDYKCSNQYNPESCRWITPQDNAAYKGRPVQIGTRLYVSTSEAARQTGLCAATLDHYLNGERGLPIRQTNPMWLFPITIPKREGYVLRYLE